MKIHLEQIKANIKNNGKYSVFVDSGIVKTSDELVIECDLPTMFHPRRRGAAFPEIYHHVF